MRYSLKGIALCWNGANIMVNTPLPLFEKRLSRRLSRRALLRNALFLGGASTLLLAGCQVAITPESTPGTEGAASESMTLRVWGYGLDDARASARVNEFQTRNPGVTLEPVGGELNTQQLLTAVASGDPPEIVNVNRSETGSWAARGAIDPLDDLIERDQFDLEQFYPVLVQQVTFNGQLFGIPQFANVDLFFVNLDVLSEAGVNPEDVDPGNWEALSDLGEQLHLIENNVLVRTGFDTKMQDGRLWLWSWANGAELISEDGTTTNFNDPLVVEALTWAKETVDRQGGEQLRAAFSQSQNFFSAQNPVLIGQTATTLFEQWLIGVMKVDPEANFTAMLPRIRNSEETLTDVTGSAFAIPRGISGSARDVAWTFIKEMTSTEAWIAGENATLADNQANNVPYHPTISGNIAADQEAWNNIYEGISPSYDQTVQLFGEALAVARYRYSGPVAADIQEAMTAAVNDALQGVRTPEEAMNGLQEQAQQAIDEFEAPQ
jgi:multiple sugar transport system substrate-binding protein